MNFPNQSYLAYTYIPYSWELLMHFTHKPQTTRDKTWHETWQEPEALNHEPGSCLAVCKCKESAYSERSRCYVFYCLLLNWRPLEATIRQFFSSLGNYFLDAPRALGRHPFSFKNETFRIILNIGRPNSQHSALGSQCALSAFSATWQAYSRILTLFGRVSRVLVGVACRGVAGSSSERE